ncbi:MAG: hypothetical protein E6X43_04310 [Peptostreptococcaceae bacterium]|nr:hypothetical protein [Peptostreptococcaceae bacterium]
MNNLKDDLKELFDSFESNEILIRLKENFIFMIQENLEFEDEYKEESKLLYFKKFRQYIDSLNQCIDKQKQISELDVNELYRIIEYQEDKTILYILGRSVEYMGTNNIEINFPNEIIIKEEIDEDIQLDLEKICNFLKKYIL